MPRGKNSVSPDVIARNPQYAEVLSGGEWEPEVSTKRKKRRPSKDKKQMFLDALEEFAPSIPKPSGGNSRKDEFHPIPGREHSVDWAWVDWRVVVEVDGGNWVGGRHTRDPDYWKINEITALGYTVFRFTTSQLRKRDTAAECISQLHYFLKSKGFIK